ncbi:MAG: UDP-N-acetylglucosamine pyrophosphorylase [Holdemanella sp.]|nr:UDP-N-acetylglucosamine pyrophosphorylase [Holdemanella sp.]
MLTIQDMYDLEHTIAKDYLLQFTYPWQALKGIKDFILAIGPSLEGYKEVSENVWVHESAIVAPTAFLGSPCIIGPKTEVRHCAFVRGSALVGANCVVGNSVELKNVILFDNVQTPHYNYVGDSILGYKSHMGAGSITSNVKSDKTLVVVKSKDEKIETGLKKMGAMLGDFVEVGCNSVLNPGTMIGRHSNIYPTSCVRGVIPENSIFKKDGTIVTKY